MSENVYADAGTQARPRIKIKIKKWRIATAKRLRNTTKR